MYVAIVAVADVVGVAILLISGLGSKAPVIIGGSVLLIVMRWLWGTMDQSGRTMGDRARANPVQYVVLGLLFLFAVFGVIVSLAAVIRQ